MNRRNFFKLAGLATGGLLLSAPLLKAGTSQRQKQQLLEQIIQFALKNGAIYADARIGKCELQGHPHPLFENELLGVRVFNGKIWRHVLLLSAAPESWQPEIRRMLRPQRDSRFSQEWYTAVFDQGRQTALAYSDPEIFREIQFGALRFGDRNHLPPSQAHALHCEILIDQ